MMPVAGVRLNSGDQLLASLITPGKGHIATLLVQLATNPVDYGKRQALRVRIGGREALAVGYVDPGGGTLRSYTIDFVSPSPKVGIEIEMDTGTQAPVTVAALRCYSGLNPLAIQNTLQSDAPRERMGISLVSPKDKGYGVDVPTLKQLFRSLPASPFLEEQAAVLYNFSTRTAEENQAEIDKLAAMAVEANVPLRIAFEMHWGGLPVGVPDGAGGTFSDLPYQQITFDPDDKVDDPGLAALMGDRYDVRFGLTVPNVWSNTPWLTYNHPRLNQLRRIRFTQALTAWKEARERLAEMGKSRLLPGQLATGDETIYWAEGVDDRKYTELNGGKPRAKLSADFNPFTVSDAMTDGVNLDPRDGLDSRERMWLHQNLAHEQQRVIDWMFAALPAERVRLAPGPLFSGDLARRNLYTEPYAMPLFPLKEMGSSHPGIELGYVRNGRSGGEYWSGEMLPWLQKARERGRIALPNLECSGGTPTQVTSALRAAYACGARYATLYNWDKSPETPKAVLAFSGSIEHPAAQEFLPAATGPNVGVGTHWEREYTAGPDAFGINRIEVFGLEVARPTPARLTLRGGDGSEFSVAGTLRAAPGKPAVSSIELPSLFAQQPESRYTVTIDFVSDSPPSIALASDGKIALRLVSDLLLERARSRAIADWQDAADILDSLREIHSKTNQPGFAKDALAHAAALFTNDWPREAYTTAIRAEQLTLPSAYSVPSRGGVLAPYDIRIDCPAGPVTATIIAYNDRSATISLRSAVVQTVTVRRSSAQIQAALSPNVPAEVTLDAPPVRKVRFFRPRFPRSTFRRPAVSLPNPNPKPSPNPNSPKQIR